MIQRRLHTPRFAGLLEASLIGAPPVKSVKNCHASGDCRLTWINGSVAFVCYALELSRTRGIGLAETSHGKASHRKGQVMPTQTSSAHFFLSWAKERIDEMDATLGVARKQGRANAG